VVVAPQVRAGTPSVLRAERGALWYRLFVQLRDTSPVADARYHQLLRAMPPERRLEAAMRLSRGVREMALAGIRMRHPQADEHELKVRLTVRLYGRAAGIRLFGTIPDDAL
jgi:hypothetical protein